jgi:hypothetical protein
VDDYAVLAAAAKEQGIRVGTINVNVFQDDDYKLGSLAKVGWAPEPVTPPPGGASPERRAGTPSNSSGATMVALAATVAPLRLLSGPRSRPWPNGAATAQAGRK